MAYKQTTTDDAPTGMKPKAVRARIDRCQRKKKDLIPGWRLNVDSLRGKSSEYDADENRQSVSTDWSMTKAKGAQLISHIPQIVVSGEGGYKAAAPVVQKVLNKRLKKAGIGAAIREVRSDVINAAGIGGILIDVQQRTEKQNKPVNDPSTYSMFDKLAFMMGVKEEPMEEVDVVVDRKFGITRISPTKLLWD